MDCRDGYECPCAASCDDEGCVNGRWDRSVTAQYGAVASAAKAAELRRETREAMQATINAATQGSAPVNHLPTDSKARKDTPICTGVLDYFPKALAEIARLSKAGNDKHNPGQPLHWAREKSTDHADCIVRHMLERGTVDEFGFLHEVSVAWRALAQLEVALEKLAAPKS